jgi:hypothetical protein
MHMLNNSISSKLLSIIYHYAINSLFSSYQVALALPALQHVVYTIRHG